MVSVGLVSLKFLNFTGNQEKSNNNFVLKFLTFGVRLARFTDPS
jgi:hypothetical protein